MNHHRCLCGERIPRTDPPRAGEQAWLRHLKDCWDRSLLEARQIWWRVFE